MPLTAGTPLNVLVDKLALAGWGDLAVPELRGLGEVLTALARVLPARSGAGKVTAPQLADQCRYTERWVRRCLELLEELEVIVWDRGGIIAGKPEPSWIRVSKAALVDLIAIARAKQSERLLAQAQETRLRVARLRTSYTQNPGRRRKKRPSGKAPGHPELVTALLSTEEVPTGHGPGEGPTKTNIGEAPASTDFARVAAARIRSDLAARRRRGARQERLEDDTGAPRVRDPAPVPHM